MHIAPIHIAAAVAIVACITDLRSRRIPNALTFGATLVAFGVHAFSSGASGVLSSGAGWLVGIALFFPFFALGGLGAGDVKLLGAIGALLGPYPVLYVALYSSIAGGLLAIVVAVRAGYLREAFSNLGCLVMFWAMHGLKPVEGFELRMSSSPRLAYALPVLTGVLVTLWRQ
jgi:prepilin peptidase CpaA